MKIFSYIILSFLFLVSTANAQTVERSKKGRYTKTTVTSKSGKRKRTVVKNKRGKVVAKSTRTPHLKYKHLPRRGAVIVKRPDGARKIRFAKRNYYIHNGVYYTKEANGYRVVRPRRGLRIAVLPIGYRAITVRSKPYFYYYGTYYTKVENTEEYEVVDAPVEAKVDALPEGYETVIEDGTTFYVLDGVYYKEVPLDENGEEWGYEVVKVVDVPEEIEE